MATGHEYTTVVEDECAIKLSKVLQVPGRLLFLMLGIFFGMTSNRIKDQRTRTLGHLLSISDRKQCADPSTLPAFPRDLNGQLNHESRYTSGVPAWSLEEIFSNIFVF
jgi:hypothetical protein